MPQRPVSDAFSQYLRPARIRPAAWRIGLGILLIAAVYLGLNLIGFAALALIEGFDVAAMAVAKLAVASTPGTALALLATFLPMALGPMVAVVLLHRRSPGTLFGPARKTAAHFAISVAVLLTVHLVVILLTDANMGVGNLPLPIWLLLLPVTIAGVALQTLAEELVFRGYLQQQLAVRFAWRAVWMMLPSLLFAALHFTPETMGQAAPYAVGAAFLFGLIAADLTARTGSIGAAWGIHFANNILAIALLSTQGTITGLALRVTQYHIRDMPVVSVLALADLLPLVFAWLVLRRILRG